MLKDKTYLTLGELKTTFGALLLLLTIEFTPPLLCNLLFDDINFWKLTVCWIATGQFIYLVFLSVRSLRRQFKAYDALKQLIKDALDVHNTELSLDIKVEEDVRPN